MTAQVIEFSVEATRRASGRLLADVGEQGVPTSSELQDFQFWTGASGRRYVHTIHSLIECPDVPNANVLLVRRLPNGARDVLHLGRLEHDAPSLNLAEIRHVGATLGANEVHVHLLAETAQARRQIELDIGAALQCAPLDNRAARH